MVSPSTVGVKLNVAVPSSVTCADGRREKVAPGSAVNPSPLTSTGVKSPSGLKLKPPDIVLVENKGGWQPNLWNQREDDQTVFKT